MVKSIKHAIKLYLGRRKWKKKNKENFTHMGDIFDTDLVHVGKGTYGRLFVTNHSDKYELSIGNYCSIAENVRFIVCGDHRLDTVSTYPFRAYYMGYKYEAVTKGSITVDDDVWFGENAIILSGTHISQGAVIAAGSVVTKDIPPYAVVGGNPARIIKYRFPEDMIEKLLEIDYSGLDKDMIIEHENQLYKELKNIEQISWMPGKRDQT